MKKNNFIKFTTIRYELTASSIFAHSVLNWKLMTPLSILWLHKEKKQQIQKKNKWGKSPETIKKRTSQNKRFYFYLIFSQK